MFQFLFANSPVLCAIYKEIFFSFDCNYELFVKCACLHQNGWFSFEPGFMSISSEIKSEMNFCLSRNIKDKIWPAEKSISKKADKQTSLKWNGSILLVLLFQDEEYHKSNTFLIVLPFILRRVWIFLSGLSLLIEIFRLPRPVVYNSG